MQIRKVCDFCGLPIDSTVCPNCHSDFTRRFEELPDFGYKPPDHTSFERMRYRNWMERVDQYKPIVFRELDSDTSTFVDLGCGPNRFVQEVKKQFPQIRAVGFDQYQVGPEVVTVDFERERLPFGRSEIDVMLLSHVLEHLENLHFVLENALDAARKVIVALPTYSILSMARHAQRRQLGGLYGLPLVPPKDRHRWIYTLRELDRFIGYHAFKFDLRYRVHYYLHPKTVPLLGRLFKNVFVHEAIYVLEKPVGG